MSDTLTAARLNAELLASIANSANAEELREIGATHRCIMARVQGRRDGWFRLHEEIMLKAAGAFARDDDRTAESLRDLARSFKRHPYLDRLYADEQASLEIVDAVIARLAELEP